MVVNFTHLKKESRFIFLLLLLLPVSQLLVAQAKFSTSVNTHETSLDSYFQVDYIIENAESIQNFAPPSFKNFKVLQGPSQSNNISIINGKMSRSNSISYILQAEKTGQLTIPGAMAIIDGKTVRSNSVSINVSKQSAGSPQRGHSMPPNHPNAGGFYDDPVATDDEYSLAPNEDAQSKIAKNLFVKLNVNKTSCYVGEPFTATYKLYSRVSSESKITKRPSFNGFSVFDMEEPAGRKNLTVEQLNGKTFKVHTIRRTQMLPLQEGTYTLEPIELDNKVEFVRTAANGRSRSYSNSPIQRMMDEFFGRHDEGTREQFSYTAKSDPVTITVRPLPVENKPAAFNGAVGQFTIRAKLKNSTLAAGDAGIIELTIQGKGNIPMINAPQMNLPEGMEAFDPVVKQEVDNSAYPLKGQKSITYTFLPQKEGDFIIPPIAFAYFDPAKGNYNTIQSDSFAIHVTKSAKDLSQAAAADSSAAVVSSQKEPSKWTDMLDGQLLFAALLILSMLIVIIYLLSNARKDKAAEKAASTSVTAPAPKSPPVATTPAPTPVNPLKEAREALNKGEHQLFYSGINSAMREAIYRKTGTLPAELTKFNLPFILKEKGIDTDTVQQIELIMKECELALYTPFHEEKDMQVLLDKTTVIVHEQLGS